MQVNLGGLAGPVGQPAGDETPAGLGESVVLPLGRRAGVFGGHLPTGVQDGAQRGGAVGRQVAVEFPGAAEVGE